MISGNRDYPAGTGTTSLDLDPFLHALISTAAELTGCEVASILELDEGGEQLHFLALPWFHQDALKTVKVPLPRAGTGTTSQASVAGWVLQNGQPAVVPDAAAEPRHFKGVDQAADFSTRSLMVPCGYWDYLAVPILYQGETLGMLEAVNKTEHAHYTEDDLTILETLASQAAIAIQNARLMNKAQHSQDQMSQLDRMKSGFIAIASHELRIPLGLILGHATFLREVIQPDYRSQLDIIIRNALRLKEIIDNLASMDNDQRGVASVRARSISIKHLIEEVMDSFQQEAEQKHLIMRCDTGQADLLVECDSSKIATALSNMIKNAITFTDPGGHIFIVAESISGYVKVSAIDDGIGIPPKDLPHIFKRFYQVESYLTRKHEGMGLGLSISKVMVEMHGGQIWAESVEGKGSNFTFLLPIPSENRDYPVNSDQAGTASQDFIS